ncbi:uncharacterized protein N7482_002866 [Penicillium canariense]|uniref:SNF2 family helicase/ATPase n=1 Tax=Penicillium canariense TaxID=189055 RepID=A0A9W9LV87_9EURO|nr:uncharacterized protein N7482_002866 [Penicillium canariense]KAJ5176989.1 hypothetical protein N7482_002866 [Penicillium canariense]
MAASTQDPVHWGVDEVVTFLCNPEAAPWADSANSPRPNPVALETALRENFINGEALLHHVDKEALKDDMGIKALGHRSSVLRAIDWLRLRSPKYRMSKQAISLLNEIPSTEITVSPVPSHCVSSSLDPPSQAPSVPSGVEPAPAATKEKRRVAPVQVFVPGGQRVREGSIQKEQSPSNLQMMLTYEHVLLPHTHPENSGSTASRVATGERRHQLSICGSPVAENPMLNDNFPAMPVSQDRSSELTAKDHAFYERILQKYPPKEDEDDIILPAYGESGSDGHYDEETWEEIVDENPDIHQSKSALLRDECDAVISKYMAEYVEKWKTERLPREKPYARALWLQAREDNMVEDYKRDYLGQLDVLRDRLEKLKAAILAVAYRSPALLRKACGSMELTLSQICHESWKLKIMNLEMCPPPVSLPPRTSRPRKEHVGDVEEESLGSDSDSVADDEASTGDSGSDFGDEAPRNLQHAVPGMSSVTALASDDSEGGFVANKRRRMIGSHEEDGASTELSLPGPFMELDDGAVQHSHSPPVVARASLALSELQETDQADEMSIETPPLNPTLAASPQDVDIEDELLVETPPLNPVNPPQQPALRIKLKVSSPPASADDESMRPQQRKSHSPALSIKNHDRDAVRPNMDDIDLFDTLSSLSWNTVQAEKDRIRLLAKSIIGLPSEEVKSFGSYMEALFDPIYLDQVQEALQAMLKNERCLLDRTEDDSRSAMRLGALFVSWHHCVMLSPQGIGKERLQKALQALEAADGPSRFMVFLHLLKKLFSSFKVWHTQRKPLSESHGMSSELAEFDRTSKKRKKKPNSKSGLKLPGPRMLSNMQKDAQERQAKQSKDRELLRMARESQGLSNSDADGQAVTFKDPVIYLHPQLGKYVKPHQLTGIQFMWRELIEANNQQGCLLAHVMGLGKTMQIISLLVTIAAAATSDNPQIRKQVPQRFHRSQTIILCPSSVVQNWVEEFSIWTPSDHHLGPIREIISRGKNMEMAERLRTINSWNEEGGVLIMSYEMLRMLILNKSTKVGRSLSPEDHGMVKHCLLSRPNIVIADEAHKLKSEKSAITQVACRFESTSRIAVTGSPLANHLSEYYQMVEWVAPGYLEDPAIFKRKFMDPIQAGSYIDSTVSQQRESLISLQLLNGILAPKVLRADTSVIASDLPAKTEFVLTIPLTELQRKAYDIFVDCARSGDGDVSMKLWSWLAIMQLCCNHPSPFREKLADRLKQPEDFESPSILSGSIQDAGLPKDLISRIESLFSKYPDIKDSTLSNRAVLLDQILDLSIQAGDKVLIFTQSIPTMDYLDLMLKKRGRQYQRIDGSMLGSDRQVATKQFNTNGEEQVLLISTRAGGVGLNMFGANRVVIFDFLFNPMWEEQAVGRAYRLGQKKPVFVYRFIAGGTFEELIFNSAVFKRQLAVRVVDKKTVVRESSRRTSQYLFPVKNVQRDEHYDVLGKDRQVLDQILEGEYSEVVLKATLSHIQDNEKDHLTEAESRRVENELRMERLKRSDPEAYQTEMKRREDAERARQQAEARGKDKERWEKMQEQQRLIQFDQNHQQQEVVLQQRFASLNPGPYSPEIGSRSAVPVSTSGVAKLVPPFSAAKSTPVAQSQMLFPRYLQSSSSMLRASSPDRPESPSEYARSSSSLQQADRSRSQQAHVVPNYNEVIVIEDYSAPPTAPTNISDAAPATSPRPHSATSPAPNTHGDGSREKTSKANPADIGQNTPAPTNQDKPEKPMGPKPSPSVVSSEDAPVEMIEKR